MKIQVSVNQELSYNLFGLNINFMDLIVFDFIKDYSLSNSCKRMQIGNTLYFELDNGVILDYLPLLKPIIAGETTISLIISKLCQFDILKRYNENSLYFCVGENWSKLLGY